VGTLVLVRHGQASFGSDDYDRLSELGHRQCVRLGEWFRGRGMRFDAVLRGTLRRHEQSLAALEEGLGTAHAAQALPGLDEYDSVAVIRTVHEGPLAPARTPEEVRGHFRLLRDGLRRWARGEVLPQGLPPYAAFADAVDAALATAAETDAYVLVVSSGGPICTAVARTVGAPPEAFVELNLRLRNSALTELVVSRGRRALHTFNHLPHLDGPPYDGWITYA
jgi:broad specificity phosphatase PhoE